MVGDTHDVPRWQVFGERMIYDNQWVRLVQVDVEPPDGHRFRHHVVRLRTVASAAVLDDDQRVLMLLRHRFATDDIGWEIPGGIEQMLTLTNARWRDRYADNVPGEFIAVPLLCRRLGRYVGDDHF